MGGERVEAQIAEPERDRLATVGEKKKESEKRNGPLLLMIMVAGFEVKKVTHTHTQS